MEKETNVKDVFTIPNLLTFARIVLITPFVVLFLNENYLAAAIVVIISGLTGCFDGLIARKFNQVTELGKILDPIADKLTLIAIVICVAIYMPIVTPVMAVLLVKDTLMLIGGTNLIKKGITPPAAKWYGKIGTIMFYLSVCTIVFLKAVMNYENDVLSFTMLSLTTVVMIFSLVKYSIIYFSLLKEHKIKNTEE